MSNSYIESTDELSDESFYDKFKKSYLPSYDFFELFFAKLFLKEITELESKNIKKIIYDIKKKNILKNLLQDVNVSFNGLEYVSDDLTKNLNILQTLGVIGRINPTYETIINKYDDSKAREKIEQLKLYSTDMDNFIKDFISPIKSN